MTVLSALDAAGRRRSPATMPGYHAGRTGELELDDVAEPLGVVAPPEAEPLGAEPVLVRARRLSLYLLVSLCVCITRRP